MSKFFIEFDITADGTYCPRCGNDSVSPFNNGFCNDCGADVENGYEAGTEVDIDEVDDYLSEWIEAQQWDRIGNLI